MVTDRANLSRRSVVSGLFVAMATPALALAPTRSLIPPARPAFRDAPQRVTAVPSGPIRRPAGGLAEVFARAGLSGETGLVALDAETGEIIEAHRADLRLPPASTAKAVTAMYALQTLGAEHRFVTRVLAQGGGIEGGTLRGDLILRGGGDPVLQTEDLSRLADALIARGLRRVEGRFLVDDTALPTLHHIDPSQPVQAGYNPGVSGVNLNFNRVHFGWSVQGGRATVSIDARSDREIPPVSVIDMRAASRDLPVYTHELRPRQERWTVAASALQQPGSRWLPVRRSAVYAGDVLRTLLMARGCRLPEATVARGSSGGMVLAEHRSAPLAGILNEMLRYSTNLTAECVGLAASLTAGHRVNALAQSAGQMNQWAEATHRAPGMGFIDHSGLGDGSRVSARTMAVYMRAAWRQAILPDLLRDHPLRDRHGNAVANHPVSVRAKTGTLNFVSALCGYAHPRGGRPIVFSIMSADLARRQAIVRDGSERPVGTRAWNGRARTLQQALIERWSQASG